MMQSRNWLMSLTAAALIAGTSGLVTPSALRAADESPFFLQEHGGVRVTRAPTAVETSKPPWLKSRRRPKR